MDTGSHWWGMSHGGVGVSQGNEVGVSAQEQDVVYYNGESEGQREEVRRCRWYEGMKDKELKACDPRRLHGPLQPVRASSDRLA